MIMSGVVLGEANDIGDDSLESSIYRRLCLHGHFDGLVRRDCYRCKISLLGRNKAAFLFSMSGAAHDFLNPSYPIVSAALDSQLSRIGGPFRIQQASMTAYLEPFYQATRGMIRGTLKCRVPHDSRHGNSKDSEKHKIHFRSKPQASAGSEFLVPFILRDSRLKNLAILRVCSRLRKSRYSRTYVQLCGRDGSSPCDTTSSA